MSSSARCSKAEGAEGDEIYVPGQEKRLTIQVATDNTSGTLIDPCPQECAGTFPLRIRFQSFASRMEGRLATLLARLLANGNLQSISNLGINTGDILRASGPGVFDAVQFDPDDVSKKITDLSGKIDIVSRDVQKISDNNVGTVPNSLNSVSGHLNKIDPENRSMLTAWTIWSKPTMPKF